MRMSDIKAIADAPQCAQALHQSGTKKRAGEACEMCGQEILSEHSHVVNLESRSLLCSLPRVLPALHP